MIASTSGSSVPLLVAIIPAVVSACAVALVAFLSRRTATDDRSVTSLQAALDYYTDQWDVLTKRVSALEDDVTETNRQRDRERKQYESDLRGRDAQIRDLREDVRGLTARLRSDP